VLVVQGSSETFNPTLDPAMIANAKAADPEAENEWSGGFRDDIKSFLDDLTIERAVDEQRPLELSPQSNISYRAFTDASGGRGDHYTVCIAHQSGEHYIADVVRGRVEQAWADCGIKYQGSEQNKSALYLEALPLFTRGIVNIPDHKMLIRELRLLERRTSRVGKDIVDHGRVGSDDYPNSVCGALAQLAGTGSYDQSLAWVNGTDRKRSDQDRVIPALGVPSGPYVMQVLGPRFWR
jgi:hypothetical protein